MSLKALLVDDEYPSRNELRFRLERYPEIEVVGEAANAREALQLCSAMDYDVVFLDIQMPGMDGVELAQALRVGGKNPKVVFVTAYEEYAVNAFKVRATDYLLKPFDDARLDDTVQRLLEGRNGREARPEGKKPQPPLAWVPTEVNGTTVPVPVEDIVYIYSEKDYVFVRTLYVKPAFRTSRGLRGQADLPLHPPGARAAAIPPAVLPLPPQLPGERAPGQGDHPPHQRRLPAAHEGQAAQRGGGEPGQGAPPEGALRPAVRPGAHPGPSKASSRRRARVL